MSTRVTRRSSLQPAARTVAAALPLPQVSTQQPSTTTSSQPRRKKRVSTCGSLLKKKIAVEMGIDELMESEENAILPTPAATAESNNSTGGNLDDPIPTSTDIEADMKLVMEAYQQTLQPQSQQQEKNENGEAVFTITKELDNILAETTNPLQERDMNRMMNIETIMSNSTDKFTQIEKQAVVLSPRTLLVPSTLPETSVVDVTIDGGEEMMNDKENDNRMNTSMPTSSPSTPSSLNSSTILLAPPVRSATKLDSQHALPAPYVTINPDLLREAAWNYRDLQLLCMRLKLGGRGTREQLVERLMSWHRQCTTTRTAKQQQEDEEEDDHPLSIRRRMKNASNFSLLQFDTTGLLSRTNAANAPNATTAATPSRSSIVHSSTTTTTATTSSITPPFSPTLACDAHANGPLAHVTVTSSLPALLTPLIYRTARKKQDGTPAKSILTPSYAKRMCRTMPKSTGKRLAFSVFNGVKLIPSRALSSELEANATPSPPQQQQQRQQYEYDEDEEEDEEEDEYNLSEEAQDHVSYYEEPDPEERYEMLSVLENKEDDANQMQAAILQQPVPQRSSSFLQSIGSSIIRALSPKSSPTHSSMSSSSSSSSSISALPITNFSTVSTSTSSSNTSSTMAHFSFDPLPPIDANEVLETSMEQQLDNSFDELEKMEI